ncbi:hypothetical protein DER45DRAFT_477375 [Fusarium avenaceum]|nr:hypothetical protein DER45DRAFT_477375 [Fusarium avenaceum]
MVVGGQTEVPAGDGEGFRGSRPPADDETEQQQPPTDNCDAETIYSIDSRLNDPKLQYLHIFVEQLADDIKSVSADLSIDGIEAEYLDSVLREFAWNLHGESSNPFEWEASVVLHRKRKNIVELLVSHPSNLDDIGTELQTSGSSEDGESDELPGRTPFSKPRIMVMQWVGNVETSPIAAEESPQLMDIDLEKHITTRLSSYRSFIKKSEAYHWLLNKIRQYDQLDFQNAEAMLEIGSKIRSKLRAQEPLRKMSSRKPLSLVKMTFNLDWDPIRFMKDAGIGFLFDQQFPNVLCLTGSWNEAQALTVAEYTSQTWPKSGQALISLLQELLSHAENIESAGQTPDRWKITFRHKPGHGTSYSLPTGAQLMISFQAPSSCSISVTGCLSFVSEIGEQLGWLASGLRASPVVQGTLACTPHIGDFRMIIQGEGTQKLMVVGSCKLTFDLEPAQTSNPTSGSCWGRLCCNAMLVHGYPIARRSEPNTGLEMSLGNMATIVGSNQIVHWNGRVIMKGFSMLLIATLAATDIIVWHLLVSEKAGERISYIDPRLDALGMENSMEISLRMLEPSRHVIGWCSKVTDLCVGDATANHNVKTSGLKKPPASIIIDRLYLEAGSDIVGGLNMSFNKKEQPFWLERESDYPSLLKWMAVQPILFYDVEDCRAWLIDGASALLHLVRISLHLEENDPESTYDWVFDVEKLKDKWDGLIGRRAALQTLKSWDNLDLNVYVTGKRRRSDGVSETQYSTLETRIKKVLHSIEILIDRQAKVVSQDGIRISQTLNLRRNITGFDVLDVLTPLGPILPRIKYLDSWRYGWDDLINSIGVTTIFGSGFGSLIRPDDPEAVCKSWKFVPEGMDYMAASVSTLQMLYERRLLRMDPGLALGHMTSKIVWSSPCHPFSPCECLKYQEEGNRNSSNEIVEVNCHADPVQFLVKKSWKSRITLRGTTPVNLATLEGKGAVVFGHIPFSNLKNEGNVVFEERDEDEGVSPLPTHAETGGILLPPRIASTTSDSTGSAVSTGITVPSLGTSSAPERQDDDSTGSRGIIGERRKVKWWKALNERRRK